MTERLKAIKAKAEWAEKHIPNLCEFINACYKQPYFISGEVDSKSQHVRYYVSGEPELSPEISLLTGDILHNLRSSLDHLAWQLVLANNKAPDRFCEFPILDMADPARFEIKVKGMAQPVKDALWAMEPYQGGKGHGLWQLHRLDIIDKHRLIVTTTTALKSFDVGLHLDEMMPPPLRMGEASSLKIALNNRVPLHKGDTLYVDIFTNKINKKIKFTFEVALHEPGIVECQPIVEMVEDYLKIVNYLITKFSLFL